MYDVPMQPQISMGCGYADLTHGLCEIEKLDQKCSASLLCSTLVINWGDVSSHIPVKHFASQMRLVRSSAKPRLFSLDRCLVRAKQADSTTLLLLWTATIAGADIDIFAIAVSSLWRPVSPFINQSLLIY